MTTQKLNIAKGEWALKQANAQQKAAQAAGKAAAAGTKSGSSGSGKATGSSGSASGGSRSTVSAGVPYTAELLRSQGKSDVAITSALRQEGYTPAQIAKILQEMNKLEKRHPGKAAALPGCRTFIVSCQKKKSAVLNSGLFGGVPSGTRTHGLQIHNLAR